MASSKVLIFPFLEVRLAFNLTRLTYDSSLILIDFMFRRHTEVIYL